MLSHLTQIFFKKDYTSYFMGNGQEMVRNETRKAS